MPQFHKNPDQYTLEGVLKGIQQHVHGDSRWRRFQKLYRNDRVAFAYDIIPPIRKTLAPYQAEILGYFDEGKTRVAVRGPHGLGKTLVAAILVHHAVLTAESDCKVPTTASAWRQLEKYLWPEVHKVGKILAWDAIGREPYDPNKELHSLSLSLGRTVEAFALASDDHTLIEGAHATRLMYIFDEAKTIPAPTWDAAEGAFSTEGLEGQSLSHVGSAVGAESEALAFAISTPGEPQGRFYDIHMRMPGYEDWHVRHVTLEEAIRAGRISKRWAEQRRVQWGEQSAMYQNRVLGEFADVGEEGAIPRSWVLAAQHRWRQWAESGRPAVPGPVTVGVDVARFGEDSTVIAVRNGRCISDIWRFPKQSATMAASKVLRYSSNRVVNIEIDGGYGAGVYDILKSQGIPLLRPITVNGKTFRKDKSGELGFANVRAAMWWNMRELLDPEHGDSLMLPPIPQLEQDLIAPRWDIKTMGGQSAIAIEAKLNIKSRLGRSTDWGDAVCLAFWLSSSGGGIVI